jgi:hypothetical protein
MLLAEFRIVTYVLRKSLGNRQPDHVGRQRERQMTGKCDMDCPNQRVRERYGNDR